MSQLLDCFAEDEIVAILHKVRAALPPNGRLLILELFWDRQRFEAAAFSLQQTSLYFSLRRQRQQPDVRLRGFPGPAAAAGLAVTQVTDGVGRFHTLLECTAAEAGAAKPGRREAPR